MKTQTPSIGRIVHYISYGTPNGEYKPEHRAAMVTGVNYKDDSKTEIESIDIVIFNPTGLFFNQRVNEGTREGQWHWPERTE
jgi:hypothetical protein